MSVQVFTFNALQENTYVIVSGASCAIVDPGCYERDEQDFLFNWIESMKLRPEVLLNTHGHIDHVLGNDAVKERYRIPLWIGEHEADTLRAVSAYAPAWGFHRYRPVEPDRLLREGEIVTIGQTEWEVLFVPGHSQGHIAFLNRVDGLCISGDVLFRQSVGRYDLPGGNLTTLLTSIRTRLLTLPDTTRIFPGHGPETTIGDEKRDNSFLRL